MVRQRSKMPRSVDQWHCAMDRLMELQRIDKVPRRLNTSDFRRKADGKPSGNIHMLCPLLRRLPCNDKSGIPFQQLASGEFTPQLALVTMNSSLSQLVCKPNTRRPRRRNFVPPNPRDPLVGAELRARKEALGSPGRLRSLGVEISESRCVRLGGTPGTAMGATAGLS